MSEPNTEEFSILEAKLDALGEKIDRLLETHSKHDERIRELERDAAATKARLALLFVILGGVATTVGGLLAKLLLAGGSQ